MNKFLTIIFFLVFTSVYAGGHLSEKDKKAGRKPNSLKHQWVEINRYSGAISFSSWLAHGQSTYYYGNGMCTVGKQLF